MRTAFSRAVAGNDALQLVDAVGTHADAVRAIAAGAFDVVLLDLDLGGQSAQDLIPVVAESARVIVVSVLGDETSVLRAIEHGATGYLLKDEAFDDLATAIAQVMAGESPLSPGVARHLLRRLRKRDDTAAVARSTVDAMTDEADDPALTPREHQVLTAFARGASYKEVAAECDISVHTVRDYVKTLYRKLQVHSRGEAVTKALRHGIVQL